MSEHLTWAAVVVPLAIVFLVLGWVALLVNGKRPLSLTVKGAGIHVAIEPIERRRTSE